MTIKSTTFLGIHIGHANLLKNDEKMLFCHPQEKEHINMAIVGDFRNLSEAIKLTDTSDGMLALQEEYKSLIANVGVNTIIKGRKAMKCKWVFCTETM